MGTLSFEGQSARARALEGEGERESETLRRSFVNTARALSRGRHHRPAGLHGPQGRRGTGERGNPTPYTLNPKP